MVGTELKNLGFLKNARRFPSKEVFVCIKGDKISGKPVMYWFVLRCVSFDVEKRS